MNILPISARFRRSTAFATIALAAVQLVGPALPAVEAADAFKWSVQYLVDNSRAAFGRAQDRFPRRNRGLAMSPDGKYMYAGYHQSYNGGGEIRRIRIEQGDFDRAASSSVLGPLAKSLATDDRGRVYATNQFQVVIYSADLSTELGVITGAGGDGVAVVREGGVLVAYTTDRSEPEVLRWALEERGDNIVSAKLDGFDGTGTLRIEGALELRGIEVDAKGRIWIADMGGNNVIRVNSDGRDVRKVPVRSPMDVAVDDTRVFVTRGSEVGITVLNDELEVVGNLNVPWEELELSPGGSMAFLSGIVAIPGKGFLVSNEGGQTGFQRSTYGRADDSAGLVEEKLFRDSTNDDNEPILRGTAVVTE